MHALLALGLQEQPDALVNPWRLQIQQIDENPEPLPIGMRITQVYDKAAGELLILGEPGAGKTTLLLELARDLLDRAEQDEEQAIPVVFNLSSWATGQQSLSEWLIGELCIKYRTPLKVAEEWIATNQLIILLDGLDEVNEAVRSRCVQAINAYQKIDKKIDKFASIVVCCRAKEYFGQETRVTLQEAVFIQPLTEGQVEDYLSSTGTQLEEARKAFHEDAELHEMMKTPLMLSIVTLAYQGNSQQKPPLLDSGQTRRQQIFEIYTQHMLHREKKTPYEEKQTIQWLSWLAQQMVQHHQTEFFIERLQPDWLPDAHTRYHYQNMVNRFHFGLSIIIYAGVYACFRGDSVPGRPGLFSWVGGGKGNTLLEWMRPGLGAGLQGAASLGLISLLVQVFAVLLISIGGIPIISRKAIQRGLLKGLRTGLSVGVPVSLFSALVLAHSDGLQDAIYRGIGLGIYAATMIGLITIIVVIVRYDQKTSKKRPITLLDRVTNFFLFSVCAAFGFGCMYALQEGRIDRLVISYALIIGFFYGIAFGLADGMDIFPNLGSHYQASRNCKVVVEECNTKS